MKAGSDPPRLEVRDLVIRYDGRAEIEGLDLTIEAAGITALVGPSGCGKTSLLRAIAGFEVPFGGTISMGGRQVVGPGRWIRPERREVGLVFQQGALFPHLTVARNVAYGVRRDPDHRRKVESTLELVGLRRFADRFPDQLSGGQQQLVALARALAPSPQMILLDEPFASLDAGLRDTMRERVVRILRSPVHATFASGAHAVELEIDPDTSEVEILRYCVVHDCGRMINPMIVDGQIHGGVAQGVGGALYERMAYDADGNLQNASFMDFLMPYCTEIPTIETDHLETPSPLNPLGIKGAGEAGVIPASAVIASAIEDAEGFEVNRMPLDPHEIHAMRQAADTLRRPAGSLTDPTTD